MRKKIYALLLGLSLPFLAIAGLESVTYISDLVVTNPLSSDPAHQGDDHLRAIKTGIKNTFPNITGAVTPTQTELNVLDGVTGITAANLNSIGAYVRKSADTSRSSTTTLADDPHLTVSAAASSVYAVQGFWKFTTSGGTGGFKYGFTLPSGATFDGVIDNTESSGSNYEFVLDAAGGHTGNMNTGATTRNVVFVTGQLTTTNAGTFALRWSQVSSAAEATIVYSGGWLKLSKVN